jgi:hypothetical protein
MRIFTLSVVVCTLFHATLPAQYVQIPDAKLNEALLEHGVDTNEDFFISFEEAEAVDSLSLFNQISDMTGIEAFTNLRYLDLFNESIETPLNLITHLDVSQNTSLEFLDCSYNQLDTLILGIQDYLLELNCFANIQLSHLDLSGCPNLKTVVCGNIPLEELDIRNCRQLEQLYLDEIFDPFVTYVWTLPFPTEGLSIFGLETEVAFIDLVPPSLILEADYLRQPGSMGFTTNENAMAYLVNSDAFTTIEEIRANCLDSVEVAENEASSFEFTDLEGQTLWILAADQSLNISEAEGFSLFTLGMVNEPEKKLVIYPNPASDQITIQTDLQGSCAIEIADINGRILFSDNSLSKPFRVDIGDFKKGIYLLRISDGQNLYTRKLIKH